MYNTTKKYLLNLLHEWMQELIVLEVEQGEYIRKHKSVKIWGGFALMGMCKKHIKELKGIIEKGEK